MNAYKFFLVLNVVMCLGCGGKHKMSLSGNAPNQSPDTCEMYAGYYDNGAKRCEGLKCNRRREGFWKDWYSNGCLKDSGEFKQGKRVYDDSLMKHLNADIVFKANPAKFFKDSDYFFYIIPNTHISVLNLTASYENLSVSEGRKKLYLLQEYNEAEDSFDLVFTPKTTGRIKLMLNLQEYAEGQHNRYPFFKRDVVIFDK